MLFAIGDVHGRADLLARLLDAVDAWAGGEAAEVIVLGDVVDRGPDSAGALDLVAETLARRPGSTLLLGNHDRWFLDFLTDPAPDPGFVAHWLGQGGRETLRSYGVDPDDRDAARRVREGHGRHVEILERARLSRREGPLLFAHAGIDPAKPVARQDEADLLWVRRPFLDHVGRLEAAVVHGHTPQRGGRPVVTENRISLDTHAVANGILTMAVWEDGTRAAPAAFLATDAAGAGVSPVEPVRLDRGLGTLLD